MDQATQIQAELATFLCRGLGDPMFGFYLFWLPEYLTRERGMDLSQMAAIVWIPFLAADVGNLVGGGVTSWLISRGWSIDRARKTVMHTMAVCTMVGMAVPFVESVNASIALLALTGLFFMTWSVNAVIQPSDWFSPRNVGTVFGLSGTGSGLGNLIMNAIVGWVLDRTGSYRAVFIGVGFLVPTAQFLVTVIGGRIERVDAGEIHQRA